MSTAQTETETPNQPPKNGSQKPGSTTLEHILPSFEMYNFIFNRSTIDNELPPRYDANATLLLQSQSGSGLSAPGIFPIGSSPTLHSNPDMLIVNNLDSNANFFDLPIEISIVLTKEDPCKPGKKLTPESKFKVFKPGDTVTGYIHIQNVSDEPIQFAMFLVSLEGNVTSSTTTTGVKNDVDLNYRLPRKRFLQMYDLLASFHLPALQHERVGELRVETGVSYGFSDGNVLIPGIKYQKEFTFQIPETLLDTVCEHQSPEHLMIPSSFGIDPACFNGKGKDIHIDNTLGYGTLSGVSGAPVKIRDLAALGQSVSYLINATMVGTDLGSYAKFGIGGGGGVKCKDDFAVIKNQQYFFNVSTTGSGLDGGAGSHWDFKASTVSTDDQIRQLQSACDDVIDELRFKNGFTADKYEKHIIHADSSCSSTKKMDQLRGSINDNNGWKSMGGGSADLGFFENVTSGTLVKSVFGKREGKLFINVRSSDKNSLNSFYIPKLKDRMVSDLLPSASGVRNAKLSSFKPSAKVSILDSYFSKKKKPTTRFSKSTRMYPTSTNQTASDKIIISITFNSKNNSSPPESISIFPSLVIFNIQSESEMPISIDPQFLLESSTTLETTHDRLAKLKTKMQDNLVSLSALTKSNDFTNEVPKTLHAGIRALADITSLKSSLPIFESIEKTLVWSKDTTHDGVFRTTIEVGLVVADEYNLGKYGVSVRPGFQTCLLSRLYSVRLSFRCDGGFRERGVFATLPIVVV